MKARRLRNYQEEALKYNALFLDMRLGKTLTAVRRVKKEKAFPSLFVTPYSNMLDLQIELENEGCSYTRLIGTREEREETLYKSPPVQFIIINTEGFLVLPDIGRAPWRSVVFDESHKIKNPKARITKFFTYCFRNVPLKIILSGDPAPEGYLDYFCQFKFLFGAAFGCRNFWDFRAKYFTPVGKHGYKWAITHEGKKIVDAYIKKHAFSMRRSHTGMTFRRKTYRSYCVEMDARARQMYNSIHRNFVLETDSTYRMTKYKVAQISLLVQLAGGFAEKKLVWDGKIKAVHHLTDDVYSNKQIIIFAQHIQELSAISEALNCKIINGRTKKDERQRLQKRFQDKRDRILLAQNACLTYGANLSAADVVIYYSNTQEHVIREQTEDRAVRVCENRGLEIIDIITAHTIDEVIYKSIRRKDTASTMRKEILKSLVGEFDT